MIHSSNLSSRVAQRLTALLALVCLASFGIAEPASAAREKREKPKTKQVQTISESVHKQLTKAQELIGEEQYADALKVLAGLEAKGDKLNGYERALMHQTFAYVYSSKGDYVKAAVRFEKCLAENALPEGTQLNLRYNLAQIYIANENYKKGIATLDQWFKDAENPAAAAYFLLATAYAQLEDYPKAIQLGKQGLAKTSEPRENWLSLLFSCYYHTKDYKASVGILQQLIEHYPKKTYFVQLSAIYGSLDESRKSMAVMELAYIQGFLTTGSEQRRMAEMFLYNELPYKGAKVLEEGISSGKIEKTEKNWHMLGQAWMQAKEFDRAEVPLQKAAELSDDGKIFAMIGQVAMEKEHWKSASAAFRKALQKGGLSSEGQVQLLLGVCLFNLEEFDGARKAFQRASKDERTEQNARRWLKHLDTRSS